jgi:hypothetical protein
VSDATTSPDLIIPDPTSPSTMWRPSVAALQANSRSAARVNLCPSASATMVAVGLTA